MNDTAEHRRLAAAREGREAWKRWGPYLSERQWGTVREDYSEHGSAWDSLPHDHARSRVYRWGEDGLAGLSDEDQVLCFALALWNGQDPILKERLFGLTGPEGNHGEDVKEYYFYLDATPSHSYLKMLYKYPQRAFPYADLVETNRRRGKGEPEYELLETGIFDDDRYFDVVVEYAKAGPDDILVRISAANRGPEAAELHLLPTLWFRNTWSWGGEHHGLGRPMLSRDEGLPAGILAEHAELGRYVLACEPMGMDGPNPMLLFTDNDTNAERLFGSPNPSPFVKDGIGEAVIRGRMEAVNPAELGTKAAAHYRLVVGVGETAVVRLRLTKHAPEGGFPLPLGEGEGEGGRTNGHATHPTIGPPLTPTLSQRERGSALTPALSQREREQAAEPIADHDAIVAARLAEADAFYAALQPETMTDEERLVQRQAFAGLLWSKQWYAYEVDRWLDGDPGQPAPPAGRRDGRNHEWRHLNTAEIISMPDKWEYPWFAAWDLAFHCIPLALLDPEFAKAQLLMLGREWFQHPNGQLPAYEWAFGDVNPPVQAWAAWRVYKIEQKRSGSGDLEFLERVFHKLMLNFTWWVNRKDAEGNNVFQGGFLGLDNIGVFDRSAPLPTGGHIEQSDGTSWMGMFCLNMLTIALELACHNRVYEDIASKFFEHFLYIARAMHNLGDSGASLWDQEDEFFYDVLHLPDGQDVPLKVRSLVGLIPLFAVTTIEPELLERLPEFRRRMEWFLEHRPELASLVSRWQEAGSGERRLLAIARGHRMKRVLRRMLDETEFLSPYGVRAISRHHLEHPYVFAADGQAHTVRYQPGESDSGLFGGNSNWRGPIWFPVNYLIVESLQQFHHYYGDDFRVECPSGSGRFLTLREIASELARRLSSIFLPDGAGRRAVFGESEKLQRDPHWNGYIPFHEYFHGDSGRGVGASHQTGWTGLVAKLLDQLARERERVEVRPPSPVGGQRR